MSKHVVIMGGGVIGLSCAFELQRRGCQVTVLEQQRCGGQASGAAAGMLAPYSENLEGPDEFFCFGRDSLQLYPAWQELVKQVSGQSFEYVNSGSLYLAQHEADLLALEGRLLWQRNYGSTGQLLRGEELHALEPALAEHIQAALFTPEESHLYAPHYVHALETACHKSGVRIFEELGKVTIDSWKEEISITAQDGRKFGGDKLVICSGAWAQEHSAALEITIPVYPIRGQICAYAYEDGQKPIQHMIFSSQGYLVAKGNGSLVCGASEDVAGFDTTVTEKGIGRLERWNKRLLPSLAQQQPYHKWAGLRPSTQDGLPLIGPLQASNRVLLAVGHYRNGILLSPATAKLVGDLMQGVHTAAYCAAFSPDRFS